MCPSSPAQTPNPRTVHSPTRTCTVKWQHRNYVVVEGRLHCYHRLGGKRSLATRKGEIKSPHEKPPSQKTQHYQLSLSPFYFLFIIYVPPYIFIFIFPIINIKAIISSIRVWNSSPTLSAFLFFNFIFRYLFDFVINLLFFEIWNLKFFEILKRGAGIAWLDFQLGSAGTKQVRVWFCVWSFGLGIVWVNFLYL